jgi:hypothetical protein
MNVDEALAIAETALNDTRLNDVQEFIFRQCWKGRQSYDEMAKLSQYDDEYIKYVAAQLWKKLSKAFGEKVKKNNLHSVLKRYLRRHQLALQRNQAIEVNLSGARVSISGTNLSVTKSLKCTHSGEAELGLSDFNPLKIPNQDRISDDQDQDFEEKEEGLEIYRHGGQKLLSYLELEREREDAQQRAERFAAKLRELNIDPDTI